MASGKRGGEEETNSAVILGREDRGREEHEIPSRSDDSVAFNMQRFPPAGRPHHTPAKTTM